MLTLTALGAPAEANGDPTIYGFFEIDGVTSLFKSDTYGDGWSEITDTTRGFGSASASVVDADSETYGR